MLLPDRRESCRLIAAVAVAAMSLGFIAPAVAGLGPENVAVVVNADSWASQTVANHFIGLRRIPPGNVVALHLADLPDFEIVSVDVFRERVLGPVLQTLQQRGLAGEIDCIAYSSDVPYAVQAAGDVGERKLPKVIKPTASVNGLTYMYQLVMAKNPNYLGLNVNWYYRPARRAAPVHETWDPPQHQRLAEANRLMREKKWEQAGPILAELLAARPDSPATRYNLACCLARQKKLDEAIAALKRAIADGWSDRRHTATDPDLRPLRGRDDFTKLLASIEPPAVDATPPLGFSNRIAWTPQHVPASDGKGMRYLLSTMLAVTTGRGNSVREAIQCLERSASADGTRPTGTVYYMANSNVRSTTRQWGFDEAAKKLREIGVKAEVLDGQLPVDQSDVAGAMLGTASFSWKGSGSTIRPGAIVEHLTSCGGIMRERGGQTPLSELIRYGAAGTAGAVTEPYALQAKFFTPFVHYYYARGCTMIEAAYQSLLGPYQLLIVGDPLCRPWAKVPRPKVAGLKAGQTATGSLTLRPGVAAGDPQITRFELFVDGHRRAACEPGQTWTLDTTELGDGHHELRVVAVAAGPIGTPGSAIVPFTVANAGHTLTVTAPPERRVAWGRTLKLTASLAGARAIVFIHNGDDVATIAGGQGTVEIDPRALGLGPARIDVIGVLAEGAEAGGPAAGGTTQSPTATAPVPHRDRARPENDTGGPAARGTRPAEGPTSPPASGPASLAQRRIAAEPIVVEVIPSRPLPAVRPAKQGPQTEGLRLTPAGGKPVVVTDTRKASFLAAAGVKADQAFTLEGWFDVPDSEVYQFQVRFAGELQLSVDAQPQPLPEGNGWRWVPVSLAKGTHRVRIEGTPAGKPALQVRFGGPGTRSLDAKRFRH